MSRSSLFLAFVAIIIFSTSSQASLESNIFKYDDSEKFLNMQVSLSGTSKAGFEWKAVNTTYEDIPFFASCYSDAGIMKMFNSSLVRKPKEAEDYAAMRLSAWGKRFEAGLPHGGLEGSGGREAGRPRFPGRPGPSRPRRSPRQRCLRAGSGGGGRRG